MADEIKDPELQSYLERIAAASVAVRDLTEGLSDAQGSWRPQPKSWSIAEVITHLNITATSYYPRLDQSLEKARAKNLTGTGPFKHGGFMIKWLIRNLEDPNGKKFKAPGGFQPVEVSESIADIAASFQEAQDRVRDYIAKSDGVHLGKAKVVSPVSSLIRMTLGKCFHLICAHQERHIAQARRIRESSEFPA